MQPKVRALSPCLLHTACSVRQFQKPRVCQPPAQTLRLSSHAQEPCCSWLQEAGLPVLIPAQPEPPGCLSVTPTSATVHQHCHPPVYPGHHDFSWMILDPLHSQTQNLETPGSTHLRNGECRTWAVPISVFLCIVWDRNYQSKPCQE